MYGRVLLHRNNINNNDKGQLNNMSKLLALFNSALYVLEDGLAFMASKKGFAVWMVLGAVFLAYCLLSG